MGCDYFFLSRYSDVLGLTNSWRNNKPSHLLFRSGILVPKLFFVGNTGFSSILFLKCVNATHALDTALRMPWIELLQAGSGLTLGLLRAWFELSKLLSFVALKKIPQSKSKDFRLTPGLILALKIRCLQDFDFGGANRMSISLAVLFSDPPISGGSVLRMLSRPQLKDIQDKNSVAYF